MTRSHHPQGGAPDADHYVIRVAGTLSPRWADAFDGLALVASGDGTTVLVGPIPDQAALHAVLRRIGDLGLALVSVSLEADPHTGHRQGGST